MARTAGLDLSPMSVLRCRAHPGNAAGPRSPPRRGPAAGPDGISMRLHRSGPDPGPCTGRRRPRHAVPSGTESPTLAHRPAKSQARDSHLRTDRHRRVAHTAHHGGQHFLMAADRIGGSQAFAGL